MPRDWSVVRLMNALKIGVGLVLLLLLGAAAHADTGIIKLTTFPGITVADGRSTITISAQIRDTTGRLVADGTQVVFSTTLGNFRDPIVTTERGYAQVVLVAGSISGVAKITASALAYNAVSTVEVEFVADRAMLAAANDYVEVVAPEYLMYSLDQKVLGGSGHGGKVHLQYREVEITADDLQLNVPAYEVRARKARLKFGKIDQVFDELYFKLNERKGYGSTTARTVAAVSMQLHGAMLAVPIEREQYSMFEVHADGLTRPNDPVGDHLFEFEDLSESASAINSKKAVAFPRREIQFHKADVYVGGAKLLTLPLFQVSLYGQTPILTEQVVNVYDNQISINYPHYLSLKPGFTSLLRFRTGDRYGRGYSTSGGAFLDYEVDWHKGDDLEGSLSINGLARKDWGLGIRHFQKIDDRSTFNIGLELPAHQSISGSGSVSRQFNGFTMSLSGNSARSLKGPTFDSSSYAFVAETNGSQIGKSPFKVYNGITATQNNTHTDFYDRSQSAFGIRSRLQMTPWKVDSSSMVNFSFTVSKLQGENTLKGLTYFSDVSLSKRLGRNASTVLTYNFAEDGFTNQVIGRHSLSMQAYYSAGRTTLSLFGNKSLDLDRLTYYGDTSYRVSQFWRLSYAYTYNRYLGSSYLDDSWMLAYRLGGRDIGLVYSRQTKRFGLQVLGAPID